MPLVPLVSALQVQQVSPERPEQKAPQEQQVLAQRELLEQPVPMAQQELPAQRA